MKLPLPASYLKTFVMTLRSAAGLLFFVTNLKQLLGDRGLIALERLMGMLLVTVGVEMLMQRVAEYLRR